MKGERQIYNDLNSDETILDLYKRHTNKVHYNDTTTGFNNLKKFCEKKGYEINNLDDPEAVEFAKYMKTKARPTSDQFGEETAEKYIKQLSTMFKWVVNNTEYADYNIFDYALEKIEFEYDDRDTNKRELTVDELRQYIRNITSPDFLMAIVLLLKTGLRVGEAANLRLRDINLDHPISREMPTSRAEIADLPDTLYVDSSYDGNKPKSYREVPIDNELKQLMVWYISQRPTHENQYLIVSLTGTNSTYHGIYADTIQNWFTDWAKSNGLFLSPHDEKNIHAHWCRHWFTTTLRANIDSNDVLMGGSKEYVQGLRGDTDSDVIDTYTQEWNTLRSDGDPEYREVYEDAMPQLLIPPQSETNVEVEESWKKIGNIVPERMIPDRLK